MKFFPEHRTPFNRSIYKSAHVYNNVFVISNIHTERISTQREWRMKLHSY